MNELNTHGFLISDFVSRLGVSPILINGGMFISGTRFHQGGAENP